MENHIKSKQKEYINISKEKNSLVPNSSDKTFFLHERVGEGGYEPIEIRFQTLINTKCEAPYDWYKDLGLDKSDASKIRRGLVIPPLWLRVKIASYFNADSSAIWKVSDIDYINLVLKQQKRRGESLPNIKKLNTGDLNDS